MSRDGALGAFDEARDRFLAAFDRVPDAALGFLKPGDDYAIGGLLAHMTWGMGHYSDVLDRVAAGGFGELRDRIDPAETDRSAEEARRGIDGAARGPALEAMRAAHDRFVRRCRDLAEADFERTSPVFYGDATEPHPTSAAVVAGWLTDHYDEHVPHVGELLTAYEAAGAAG